MELCNGNENQEEKKSQMQLQFYVLNAIEQRLKKLGSLQMSMSLTII